jgi:hypothetical protein
MSTQLGILSDKGRETVKQEEEMLNYLAAKWDVNWIPVSKGGSDSTANVDGFFIKSGVISAVYESKCRTKWEDYDSLLITADKIDKGAIISSIISVPFLVLLHIVPEGRIYYWKVTDSHGGIIIPIERKTTKTQATINGGSAVRENAFLSLMQAKQMTINDGIEGS